MGFFDSLGGPFLSALNPVGLAANLGVGILGGGLDYLAAEKDRQQAADQASTANRLASEEAEKNRLMQLDFAKNGIRWRVEDAVAAGLHPLAALGASGVSYSPISTVFDGGPSTSSAGNSFRAIGRLSDTFGQNLSRSIRTTMSPEEKALQDLALKKAAAEVDFVNQQIAESKYRMMQPVGPQPGIPSAPHVESRAYVPEYQFSAAGPGRLGIQPSNEFAMRNASNFLDAFVWALRKRIDPPPSPDSRYKYFNPVYGEYRKDPDLIWNPIGYSKEIYDNWKKGKRW